MKMKGKSPMMKALVGNQKNLNEGLKAAIKAAPGKIMEKTPMNMKMESAIKIGMAKKPAPMKVAKPDFPDIDGDGDRKESISKAAADKKAKSPAKIKTGKRRKFGSARSSEMTITKTVQKKRKKQEPITSVKPKPIPSVAKKEGEPGKPLPGQKAFTEEKTALSRQLLSKNMSVQGLSNAKVVEIAKKKGVWQEAGQILSKENKKRAEEAKKKMKAK
jgi:hypothetical protein